VLNAADNTTASQDDERRVRLRPGGRSARVREAVLDATLSLMVEQEPLSIARIAARAGVHESSIYRRWGTREALVIDAVGSRLSAEIPLPDTGTLRGDLVILLQRNIDFQLSPLGRQLMRAAAIDANGADIDVRRDYWPKRFERIGVMFERAIARGEIPPGADTTLVAELLIAPFHFRALVSHAPFDDNLAERLTNFVLSGLHASDS
jgi:AcrR family transcriptional regulator